MGATEIKDIIFELGMPFSYDGKGNYVLSTETIAALIKNTEEITKLVIEDENKELVPEVKEVPKAKAESKPVKTTPTKKCIDKGKVMALHKAGWSNVKIADEMHCKPCTVSNILREFK